MSLHEALKALEFEEFLTGRETVLLVFLLSAILAWTVQP